MQKRNIAIAAVVLGIVFIIIGIVYFVEPAKSLPFPDFLGHKAGSEEQVYGFLAQLAPVNKATLQQLLEVL